MYYVDANVFVDALIDEGKHGEAARKFFKNSALSQIPLHTSVLTIDEVAWSVKKSRGRPEAARAGKTMLEISNLTVVPVDLLIIRSALEFVEGGLDPRDAIHVATMRQLGITNIITDDAHFDKISSITRIRVEKLV